MLSTLPSSVLDHSVLFEMYCFSPRIAITVRLLVVTLVLVTSYIDDLYCFREKERFGETPTSECASVQFVLFCLG